ncbi:MAG TPA: hypothetical protein VNH17_21050 [Streptosporangiaceae bacterium]|nr:hypothetical protein [Streptosporangiaceae bacterium]
MRFIGLVFVLSSAAIAWFLGIKGTGNVGTDVNNMRTRLAQLLNLPGLAPPGSSPTNVSGTMAPVAPTVGALTGPGPGGLGFTGRGRQV